MGGSALKSIETRRVLAQELADLRPEIEQRLRTALGEEVDFRAVPAYRQKSDFGDLDIVVASDALASSWKQDVINTLGSRDHRANGPILSVEYRGLQVDLIRHPEKEFEFAWRYYSFNDLGNLIGRTARAMGMKFGAHGLFYPFHDPDNPSQRIADVLVTRDFPQALTILGFDPRRFEQGFEDREAIFTYAVTSPYFDPERFLLKNLSHENRIRDSKRSTYRAFLEYLEEQSPPPGEAVQALQDGQEPVREALYQIGFQRACQFGQSDAQGWGFEARYVAQQQDCQDQKAYRERLNGQWLRSQTGLDGKPLGALMKRLREQFPPESLLALTVDEAREQVLAAAHEQMAASDPLPDSGHDLPDPR